LFFFSFSSCATTHAKKDTQTSRDDKKKDTFRVIIVMHVSVFCLRSPRSVGATEFIVDGFDMAGPGLDHAQLALYVQFTSQGRLITSL
jgi:hypothetical protein